VELLANNEDLISLLVYLVRVRRRFRGQISRIIGLGSLPSSSGQESIVLLAVWVWRAQSSRRALLEAARRFLVWTGEGKLTPASRTTTHQGRKRTGVRESERVNCERRRKSCHRFLPKEDRGGKSFHGLPDMEKKGKNGNEGKDPRHRGVGETEVVTLRGCLKEARERLP